MIKKKKKEVTLRFLKTRKNDGFLNIISIFSFIGISLGVAVLTIVMSVMNGFRTELINKIVGFNAHAIVQPVNNSKVFTQSADLYEKIFSSDGEAVILSKDNTKGIFLKGYLENDFKPDYPGSIMISGTVISDSLKAQFPNEYAKLTFNPTVDVVVDTNQWVIKTVTSRIDTLKLFEIFNDCRMAALSVSIFLNSGNLLNISSFDFVFLDKFI